MEDTGPWHRGEHQARTLAGIDRTPGGSGVRDAMPDQHRLFFSQLPFVVAATVDETGAPMATLLVGGEGFIASPDPRTLAIAAVSADPTGQRLLAGAPLALLGIEPHTRRRNRANGRITFAGEPGLLVAVEQSFGNCPQYIHPRDLRIDPNPDGDVETLTGLDPAARAQIAAADTFFVATASGPGVAHGGIDISHRGGPAGFVRIDGDALTIPDYRGNRYFNTLGNLVLEPRCALLFIDFATGLMLQLQGTAQVLWDDASLPDAERTWRFRPSGGFRGPAGLRLA